MSLDLEHNAWPSDSAATVISIDAEVIISRTGSYIAFMLETAAQLGLTRQNRTKKTIIEQWLREHWPAELGKPSRDKVASMATFLRDPKYESGGFITDTASPLKRRSAQSRAPQES